MTSKEEYYNTELGENAFSSFIRGFTRVLVTLLVWPIFLPKRAGKRLEPVDEGCILIANHHHILDPIFITYYFPSPRLSFVAKQELYRMKLIGRILKAFRTIPLDRSSADIRASKLILSEIKAGKVVAIFPEGTRVKPDTAATAPLHESILIYAIRRGIPVLPVSVRPRYKLFGRPVYTFGQPVRYQMKGGETPGKDIQEGIAREIMRRIYAQAGLTYDYLDHEYYRRLFDQQVTWTPVPGTAAIGRAGR